MFVDYVSMRKLLTENSNVETTEDYLNTHAGVPSSPRYWKNIIPEYYEVSTDFIDGVDIVNNKIQVLEQQSWTQTNEGVTPYYPVIPLIDEYGKFTELLPYDIYLEEDKKPFGSSNRNWDEEDLNAPITNKVSSDKSLIVDLDFNSIIQNSLEDNSGNQNKGMLIGDYKLDYEDGTRKPSRGSRNVKPKVNKEKPVWK